MADIKNYECSCQTEKNACCTCVSFHCDKCKPNSRHTQYQAGSFCSACGRPVGEKGEPPLKTIERLNEEIELLSKPAIKPLAQYRNMLTNKINSLIDELAEMRKETMEYMKMFRNINDESVWTMEDMKKLREDEKSNGFYIYEDFNEWLENKLEVDFERVENG